MVVRKEVKVKSLVLSNFDMIWLTVSAFLIFLSFFVFIVYWTFRTGSKKHYIRVSELPLSEGISDE